MKSALIIGAGFAGCTAADLLKEQGYRVDLPDNADDHQIKGRTDGESRKRKSKRSRGTAIPAKAAAVAQLVEHVLGKDEVIGSSPISSSSAATIWGSRLDRSLASKSSHLAIL